MSLRTGLVVTDYRPAFQASVEFGFSTSGKRQGMSGTYEVGTQSAAHTQGFVAMNLDLYQKDRESLPVGRLGVRVRGTFSDAPDGDTAGVLLRGTAFTGLGRDAKTGSGGLGVEIAGGMAFYPQAPILEANLVFHGRWNLMN